MNIPVLMAETVEPLLDWPALVESLAAGHRAPPGEVGDQFLGHGGDILLSRAAWLPGLGVAVKSVTVMPGNAAAGRPTVQGALVLFDDATGAVEAVIDNALITRWKTAADSLLGARLLARPDSRRLAILGAGTVAASLVEGYRALFAGIDIVIWNRTRAGAERLAAATGAGVADSAEAAVRGADIVACATMSKTPVLRGDWLEPGQHVDLIGAFTAEMREADDAALRRSRIFVDARATTLDHIGELMIPLAEGVITRDDVLGDLYDLVPGRAGRRGADEITLFKNGGGAHLDLMTARYILGRWRAAQA